MFDRYEQIRIINLPERKDRRREMLGELERVGLAGDPRVQFFNAIRPDSMGPWINLGWKGSYLSHLAILKEASSSVLILEDDCDFTSHAASVQPSVDILWGGYERTEGFLTGAHCMGFSAEAVARLIPYLDRLALRESPPPIDGAYSDFIRDNPDVTVHLCAPQIAVQRPSYSDIAGRRGLDRVAALRPLMSLLRVVKRRWVRARR